MPNRLGLLHVRPSGEKQATDNEDVDKVIVKVEKNLNVKLLLIIFAHKVAFWALFRRKIAIYVFVLAKCRDIRAF